MPFEIVRNDIVHMQVDAIVNAAAPELLGGGGVDGAIHKAAGLGLLAECRTLGGCATGSAKVTGAYDLPAKYVIHTVGPVWQGGGHGERELLASCYRTCLQLALELGCKAVAFPLISSGAYGYPVDQALRVAVDTIGGFLLTQELTVYLVIFDKAAYRTGNQLFDRIAAYIDDRYTEPFEQEGRIRRQELFCCTMEAPAPMAPAPMDSLEDLLLKLDAGFSETLLQLIDRSGKKDSEVYKKANLDRKLFSKIRSNPNYKPSKPTALALAIALELDLEQTEDLIGRAGYALSPSFKFDLIIEYCIQNGIYDVFQINEALFAFDQPLLGG